LGPLIGPVTSLDLRGIGWVIAGGESGPGARPMAVHWAREVRDLCGAAAVPFFYKQHGSVLARSLGLKGKGGGADALLDGREWKEFPP
jgi:protein gp37